MEFFDTLVLPQSAHHIQLINYLLIAIYFLFIPYIGIMLISGIVSLIYRKKGMNSGNGSYLDFAAAVIRIPTINKSIGIVLGILPFITITLMISQIMHGTGTNVLKFLFSSFVLATIAVILIYTFRYTLDFEGIYRRLKNKVDAAELDEELAEKHYKSSRLAGKAGWWGVIFLAVSLWLLFTATTVILNPSLWKTNTIFVLFSWRIIIYFLQFLALSTALTGAVILFGYFYWEGGVEKINEELAVLLKKNGLHFSFWGALALPLFIAVSLFSLNPEFLSGRIFAFSVIALVLLLIAYNLIYGIVKENNLKLSGAVFFTILFAVFSLIIKDQSAVSNATEQQVVILDSQFQKYLAGLTGDRGAAEVSGKEIFDVRCSSCHKFDQKLVGPAYKDVLPKYEGKIDQLTGFILNPTKINPQFPPMPNPGLKPNEAKAVAGYILENYKK